MLKFAVVWATSAPASVPNFPALTRMPLLVNGARYCTYAWFT
jgi:hypothetical protein